jgi:hypothetical protein
VYVTPNCSSPGDAEAGYVTSKYLPAARSITEEANTKTRSEANLEKVRTVPQ